MTNDGTNNFFGDEMNFGQGMGSSPLPANGFLPVQTLTGFGMRAEQNQDSGVYGMDLTNRAGLGQPETMLSAFIQQNTDPSKSNAVTPPLTCVGNQQPLFQQQYGGFYATGGQPNPMQMSTANAGPNVLGASQMAFNTPSQTPRHTPALNIPAHQQHDVCGASGFNTPATWSSDGRFDLPASYAMSSPSAQMARMSAISTTPGSVAFPTFSANAGPPMLTPETPTRPQLHNKPSFPQSAPATPDMYYSSNMLMGIHMPPTMPSSTPEATGLGTPSSQQFADGDDCMPAMPFSEQRFTQVFQRNHPFSVPVATRIQEAAQHDDTSGTAINYQYAPATSPYAIAPRLHRLSVTEMSDNGFTADSLSPASSISAATPNQYSSAPPSAMGDPVAPVAASAHPALRASVQGVPNSYLKSFKASDSNAAPQAAKRRHSEDASDAAAAPRGSKRGMQRACIFCYLAHKPCKGNPCERCEKPTSASSKCVSSRFDEQNIFYDYLSDELKAQVHKIKSNKELFKKRADQALALHCRRPVDFKAALEVLSEKKLGHANGHDEFFSGEGLRYDTVFGPMYQASILLQGRSVLKAHKSDSFCYTEQFEQDLLLVRALSSIRVLRMFESRMEKNKMQSSLARGGQRARNLVISLGMLLEQTLGFQSAHLGDGPLPAGLAKMNHDLAYHLAHRLKFMADFAFKTSHLSKLVHIGNDLEHVSIDDTFWVKLRLANQEARERARLAAAASLSPAGATASNDNTPALSVITPASGMNGEPPTTALGSMSAPGVGLGLMGPVPGLIVTSATFRPEDEAPPPKKARRFTRRRQEPEEDDDSRDDADASSILAVRSRFRDSDFTNLTDLMQDVSLGGKRPDEFLTGALNNKLEWDIGVDASYEEMFGPGNRASADAADNSGGDSDSGANSISAGIDGAAAVDGDVPVDNAGALQNLGLVPDHGSMSDHGGIASSYALLLGGDTDFTNVSDAAFEQVVAASFDAASAADAANFEYAARAASPSRLFDGIDVDSHDDHSHSVTFPDSSSIVSVDGEFDGSASAASSTAPPAGVLRRQLTKGRQKVSRLLRASSNKCQK